MLLNSGVPIMNVIKYASNSPKKILKFSLRNLGWRSGFELPPYRLQCLNMNSLEKRREVAMFKMIKGLIDAPNFLSKIVMLVVRIKIINC